MVVLPKNVSLPFPRANGKGNSNQGSIGADLLEAMRIHNETTNDPSLRFDIPDYKPSTFSTQILASVRDAFDETDLGEYVGKLSLDQIRRRHKNKYKDSIETIRTFMFNSYPVLELTEGYWGFVRAVKIMLTNQVNTVNKKKKRSTKGIEKKKKQKKHQKKQEKGKKKKKVSNPVSSSSEESDSDDEMHDVGNRSSDKFDDEEDDCFYERDEAPAPPPGNNEIDEESDDEDKIEVEVRGPSGNIYNKGKRDINQPNVARQAQVAKTREGSSRDLMDEADEDEDKIEPDMPALNRNNAYNNGRMRDDNSFNRGNQADLAQPRKGSTRKKPQANSKNPYAKPRGLPADRRSSR